MGRKKKHEEHGNHERWVISYADMVTLLFALFVVLYALGEVKLKKLKQVKQSLAFAFSFEGEGKTDEDGIYDRGESGGDLIEGIPLLTAQNGEMVEYLLDQLPSEYEEMTGKSIEIQLLNDQVSFKGNLSDFFYRAGSPKQELIKADVEGWLQKLVENSTGISSKIRVIINAPRRPLGRGPDGKSVFSSDLCMQRLRQVHRLLPLLRKVTEQMVTTEFKTMDRSEYAGKPGTWENQGTIAFSFSN
ncbi:MAG: flagellar motor protein MotB [Planctomycetota bacterium]|jgi:hypothetical protein